MNEIFTAFLEDKIKKFKNDFLDLSKSVFLDKQKKNNLIHPGEFGVYREKIVSEFISSFLIRRLAIGSGFLINSKNEHSTQCDIVIYSPNSFPKLEYINNNKFYPVESVCGIGEVKSNLNKEEFLKALVKLSKIKMICDNVDTSGGFDYRAEVLTKENGAFKKFNRSHCIYDQIFTFLVCEKLDFDFKAFIESNEFDTFYEDKSIEHRHRHNIILSIDDGVLLLYTFNKLDWIYPIKIDGTGDSVKDHIHIDKDESNFSIKIFCQYLMILLSSTTTININLLGYIT